MEQRQSSLTIPGAIIIAAAIIAIAIIYVLHPVKQQATTTATVTDPNAQMKLSPVTDSDHIYGNPNAPVKIVEFADASCPYCKAFNPTMTQIMDEYGPKGQVAWVYRFFPLDTPDENGNVLHPNAGTQAQAFECAASLGGNAKFWAYEKEWYSVFPDDGADRSAADDLKQIQSVGKDIGLDPVAFNDCISSGSMKARVQAEYVDGINAGVTGTPYSIIITPSGTKVPLVGAQSYTTVKAAIDSLLPANTGTTGSAS